MVWFCLVPFNQSGSGEISSQGCFMPQWFTTTSTKLSTKTVRIFDQILILRQCTKMLVNRIKVYGCVTVIIARRVIVIVVNRIDPDCGDTEVVQIIKVLPDPAQITAVIRPRLRAVVSAGRLQRRVVRSIAIRESVRHDEVDHVVGTEALKAVGRRSAGSERERDTRRTSVPIKLQAHWSWLCSRGDIEPDKEVVTGFFGSSPFNSYARSLRVHLHAGQVLAFHQEHWRRHAQPPVRRIDFLNGRSSLRKPNYSQQN